MEKVIQPVLSLAAQYGLAFIVMALTIVGLSYALVVLWKYLNKRDKENAEMIKQESQANREVIKENTTAFHNLQNLITSKL